MVHHAIDSAKIETVFRSKKDRHVVELAIEFNLSAIHEWLDKGGEIKDTEKMAKDWDSDAVIQSYFIYERYVFSSQKRNNFQQCGWG